MRITINQWKQLFKDTLHKKECFAGMQNMNDAFKADKFATKKGYELANTQQLRSLITEANNTPIMFFILKLINEQDLVVCHKGVIETSNWGDSFLKTKPVNLFVI